MTSLIFFIAFTASSQDFQSYRIEKKNITFYHNDELRITSSKKCELNKEKSKCKNFDFLYSISAKKNGVLPSGNPNPASITCKTQLGGQSVIGTAGNQNQNSFCYLKDKDLYIDNGTLNYYASKNDGFVPGKSKIRGR